jgi:hypothetical protein
VSAEVFPTFDRAALVALKSRDIPRVRASQYFSKIEAAGPEADDELAQWDTYFAQFAKMTDAKCVCCGNTLSCWLGMGFFGGFEWGMVHGDGHCAYCRYPMRGHHHVDNLGSIRNLFLPYHPSVLVFPAKEP